MPKKITNVIDLEGGDKLVKYSDGSSERIPADQLNIAPEEGVQMTDQHFEQQSDGTLYSVTSFDNGHTYMKPAHGQTFEANNNDTDNTESKNKSWLRQAWDNGDAARNEQARQSWDDYMPHGGRDYSSPDTWQKIANTPDGSKLLKTKALGGNKFPWQRNLQQMKPKSRTLSNISPITTMNLLSFLAMDVIEDIDNLDIDNSISLSSTHQIFYSTIAVDIYEINKQRGNSIFAGLVVISQAAIESAYGTSSASKINNFFGIMGGSSGVKTSHGTLKSFNTVNDGIEAYFNMLREKWPNTNVLYKRNSFTSDDLNRALNTGNYEQYPAYFVKDAGHNYDYGNYIIDDVMINSTKRFVATLKSEINRLSALKIDFEKTINPFLYTKIQLYGLRQGIGVNNDEMLYLYILINLKKYNDILKDLKAYE